MLKIVGHTDWVRRISSSLLIIVLIGGVGFHAAPASATQPNKAETPGVLCTPDNPDFQEYRYDEQIAYCKRNVSHAKKLKVAEAYGIPEADWSDYEFDHLLPLAIGGSSDIENIWPEPLDEAHKKDKVEQEVYNGMNDGTLTQDEAVQKIWDWVNAN